jgi:hypothetical protein
MLFLSAFSLSYYFLRLTFELSGGDIKTGGQRRPLE